MQITFHGAARNVTGSKHLLTLDNSTKILLDCGLYQGLGEKTFRLNEDFGFDPAEVSAVILSHAHIDHSGLLPKLVREGFAGKIFCTEATKELTGILLEDSANIQMHEADLYNKRNPTNDEQRLPLYGINDVTKTMALMETVPYNESFEPVAGVSALFCNAGHLVGSASVHLTVSENDGTTTILFSGDVGRYRSALLKAPDVFPSAQYIILESTYGNSIHDPIFNAVDPLLKAIKKTCLSKKGKLIIPAFSVGRTQEVLFALNQLELEKRLPEISYFVDSPLGKKATETLKHHMDQFNDRLQNILKSDDDPFDFKGLKYIEIPEDSKQLESYKEPCVIIASSGTADAGRVKHHIRSSIEHSQNTVLFVGHCQEQSLGGKLLRGEKQVEIFGDECVVSAEVDSLHSMSAHGDSNDLINFISCCNAEEVKGIFLVHGEYPVQQAFAEKLERKGYKNIMIPCAHESFIFDGAPAA